MDQKYKTRTTVSVGVPTGRSEWLARAYLNQNMWQHHTAIESIPRLALPPRVVGVNGKSAGLCTNRVHTGLTCILYAAVFYHRVDTVYMNQCGMNLSHVSVCVEPKFLLSRNTHRVLRQHMMTIDGTLRVTYNSHRLLFYTYNACTWSVCVAVWGRARSLERESREGLPSWTVWEKFLVSFW